MYIIIMHISLPALPHPLQIKKRLLSSQLVKPCVLTYSTDFHSLGLAQVMEKLLPIQHLDIVVL